MKIDFRVVALESEVPAYLATEHHGSIDIVRGFCDVEIQVRSSEDHRDSVILETIDIK